MQMAAHVLRRQNVTIRGLALVLSSARDFRMNPTRLVVVSLGFLTFAALAVAKDDVNNPHWFSKDDVAAIVAQIPPPPAAGSEAETADLQEEVEAEKTRTPERIAEAKLDVNYSVTFFTKIVGPKLTAQNDPVTFHFFDELNRQIAEVVGAAKDHFKRLRPYLGHPDLIHPLFPANGYSYPSGHATHAFAFAAVLGEIFPDRRAAFLERAKKIAASRVDAGVHYTSDIKEGEVVGDEIAKELLAKPAFQQELKAAEAEVAAQK
jgi:acid phosphatase/acid phosphatase (class A)